MEDTQIVELYWQRKEEAIAQTQKKYGKYCTSIAFRILQNREDSAECVNSAYLKAWNAIPPHRPQMLGPFLGKITRNLALNELEKASARKRGQNTMTVALEELEECIPAPGGSVMEDAELAQAFNTFLKALSAEKRRIFVSRYWALTPIQEIARENRMTEGQVKTALYRLRRQLRAFLEQEEIAI